MEWISWAQNKVQTKSETNEYVTIADWKQAAMNREHESRKKNVTDDPNEDTKERKKTVAVAAVVYLSWYRKTLKERNSGWEKEREVNKKWEKNIIENLVKITWFMRQKIHTVRVNFMEILLKVHVYNTIREYEHETRITFDSHPKVYDSYFRVLTQFIQQYLSIFLCRFFHRNTIPFSRFVSR